MPAPSSAGAITDVEIEPGTDYNGNGYPADFDVVVTADTRVSGAFGGDGKPFFKVYVEDELVHYSGVQPRGASETVRLPVSTERIPVNGTATVDVRVELAARRGTTNSATVDTATTTADYQPLAEQLTFRESTLRAIDALGPSYDRLGDRMLDRGWWTERSDQQASTAIDSVKPDLAGELRDNSVDALLSRAGSVGSGAARGYSHGQSLLTVAESGSYTLLSIQSGVIAEHLSGPEYRALSTNLDELATNRAALSNATTTAERRRLLEERAELLEEIYADLPPFLDAVHRSASEGSGFDRQAYEAIFRHTSLLRLTLSNDYVATKAWLRNGSTDQRLANAAGVSMPAHRLDSSPSEAVALDTLETPEDHAVYEITVSEDLAGKTLQTAVLAAQTEGFDAYLTRTEPDNPGDPSVTVERNLTTDFWYVENRRQAEIDDVEAGTYYLVVDANRSVGHYKVTTQVQGLPIVGEYAPDLAIGDTGETRAYPDPEIRSVDVRNGSGDAVLVNVTVANTGGAADWQSIAVGLPNATADDVAVVGDTLDRDATVYAPGASLGAEYGNTTVQAEYPLVEGAATDWEQGARSLTLRIDDPGTEMEIKSVARGAGAWTSAPAAGSGDVDQQSEFVVTRTATPGDTGETGSAGPTAEPGVPETLSVGQRGTFTASGSADRYEWSFDDGATATGQTVEHAYDDPGNYTVSLTVTDDDGATDTADRTVTVTDGTADAPVASFGHTPGEPTVSETVTFDASGSSAPGGSIDGYEWSLGDGATATGQTVDHTYDDPGNYTVSLTVTDDDGAADTTTRQVTVSEPNTPPVASVAVTPSDPTPGERVTFDASGSSDPDGSVDSYEWFFGDGTTATGQTVEHAYEASDNYTVSLTVTDNDGATDTTTRRIAVAWRPGTEQWRLGTNGAVQSSPTVVDDTVYVVATGGTLYAVDSASGEERWRYDGLDAPVTAPVTVRDGTAYAASIGGTVAAIDTSDGTELWRRELGGADSPLTVADGTIYVGASRSDNGTLYALDAADGSTEWTRRTSYVFRSAPTVVDGTVYFADGDSALSALDAADGTEEWTYETEGSVESSPTVADGAVYVGSNDTLYAVEAESGEKRWAFRTETAAWSSPTVADGTVYVGAADGLHALSTSDGTVVWQAEVGRTIRSGPTVANGTVYAGVDDGVVAVGTTAGAERWHARIGAAAWSSPTVVDGTVYVSASDGPVDGSLHAIRTGHAGSSEGSRVLLGTLGHHGAFATQGPTRPESEGGDGNAPPTAAFSYTPSVWGTSDTLTFDASESSDPDGSIEGYEWSFGDGTTATGQTVTHSYDDAGSYTVSLTVTDDDGATYTTTEKLRPGGQAGTVRWNRSIDLPVDRSSPTVVNGTVYVGSRVGLHAFDAATGTELWTREVTGETDVSEVSPTVAGGTVYVAPSGGNLTAIDASDGTELWRHQTGHATGSPTVADGTVYVGGDGVYAIDAADGTREWVSDTYEAFTAPTVANGTVYVGGSTGGHPAEYIVSALDATDGTTEWTYETNDTVESAPTVADGTVYVGSNDGAVHAIDAADGTERWTYRTGDFVISSPTVASDTVYVGSGDNNLYALDAADGDVRWRFETGGIVLSSPTVADGTVYVGSFDANLYAVNAADGTEKWRYDTGLASRIRSSPIVVDGLVYLGGFDSSVYAINTDHSASSTGSRVTLGTLNHHDGFAQRVSVGSDGDRADDQPATETPTPTPATAEDTPTPTPATAEDTPTPTPTPVVGTPTRTAAANASTQTAADPASAQTTVARETTTRPTVSPIATDREAETARPDRTRPADRGTTAGAAGPGFGPVAPVGTLLAVAFLVARRS